MATEIELTGITMDLLRSKPAQQIDFTCGAMHVDAGGFISVFCAILNRLSGAPGVGIEISNEMPAGAAAAYDNDKDVLRFRTTATGKTPSERSSIIHECVHAMRDILGGPLVYTTKGAAITTAAENEATAYVAAALFRIYDGAPTPTTTTEPLFVKASTVANKIANLKGAVVSDADLLAMRNIVVGNPVYRSIGITTLWTPDFANGLRSPWRPYGWR